MYLRNAFYLLITSLLALSVFGAADDAHKTGEPTSDQDKMSRIKQVLKSRDVDITFYGKVVDQYGDPVEDAEILIHITHYSPNPSTLFGGIKKVNATTDATGLFVIKDNRGRSLYLDDIRKLGYEFSKVNNPQRGFKYSGAKGEKILTPQEEQPVVFRLRKKGKTTCLSRGDFDYQFGQDDEPCYLDIIRPAFLKKSKLRVSEAYGSKPIQTDVVLGISSDEMGQGFIATFAVTGTGGLIVSDDLLHIAPANGYTSNLVVSVSNNKDVRKHIYVKAREGRVYGRLDVTMNAYSNRVSHQRRINVRIELSANPYGDRNLEDDPNIPYDLKKKLIKKAEEDLREGRLPERPDLQKLIKAEEAKKTR